MPFGLIYYYLYYPVKVMVAVLYAVICERQRVYHVWDVFRMLLVVLSCWSSYKNPKNLSTTILLKEVISSLI